MLERQRQEDTEFEGNLGKSQQQTTKGLQVWLKWYSTCLAYANKQQQQQKTPIFI
jgi:hypothetical protein